MKNRKGKVTTGGHSSIIPGLREFTDQFNAWPEVSTVKLGRISQCSGTSGGGGLRIRPTRMATVGPVTTGVLCEATAHGQRQVVVFTSPDPQALWARLVRLVTI